MIPEIRPEVLGLLILGASYLAARGVSFLLGHALVRRTGAAGDGLEPSRLAAVKRPLTYALFLLGASVAVERLNVQRPWAERAEGVLYVIGVVFMALAVVRSYAIALERYTARAGAAPGDHLAAEFGPLLGKAGNVVIALVAAIIAFEHLGINVASLVVSLGAGSLALGLAAQDTLTNMFAGFTLMLDRPFRVGDRIQLASGEVGDVVAIGMRATRIKTTDETLLIVPNNSLVKERLINQAYPGRHITTRIEVNVPYGSDLDLVKRQLTEAAVATEYADRQFAPVALVSRLGDTGVSCTLVFWARDYAEQGLAKSRVQEDIYRRLAREGITPPVPVQRVIHEGAPPAPPHPREA